MQRAASEGELARTVRTLSRRCPNSAGASSGVKNVALDAGFAAFERRA
jgi:hypothetical protein